ncbi:putative C2H2 finger domain protein [Aspergillus novofumigatus IBT 16806]|uniref:Putative C2H2 finger domain protein n=1 Tax=Aspergillus novofumigatus (strain IBT 16806) TaxID=1392255 RepID=A0A2I1CNZ2_ASPN1|nr:putative C2H2 finger domain protein [Aspergillus novofumigatus IBT 16806]PKX99340.1 putative C2H2 finger domain protein [Aspergillus novofumigatus IBT 16806]
MHSSAYADILPMTLGNRVSFEDCQLYPASDPCTDPAYFPSEPQFQLRSSDLQSLHKTHYFPTYTSWTDASLPSHIAGPLSVMETGLHPVLLSPDRVASPWSSYSSISGAESPGSSVDGSFVQSNMMEPYPSPPYAYDDLRDSSVKTEQYSSPVMSVTSSVALPQIQTYPDPEPMVESSYPVTAPAHPFVYEEHDCSEGLEAVAAQAHRRGSDSISGHKTPPPSLRHRKSRCTPQKSSSPNRVTKRKTRVKSNTKVASASKQHSAKSTTKSHVFVCSFSRYGCASTFASKNEWKRHIASQHVQLGYFRCDVGNCNGGHRPSNKNASTSTRNHHNQPGHQTNDFNRKDLFTQHQRRMHAPWVLAGRPDATTEQERKAFEASLEDVRARCWHEQRKPPQQSSCGFCGHSFSGPNSWNDRMDHVGRHFEKDETPLEEAEDIALRNWAISEGIIQRDSKGQWMLTALC